MSAIVSPFGTPHGQVGAIALASLLLPCGPTATQFRIKWWHISDMSCMAPGGARRLLVQRPRWFGTNPPLHVGGWNVDLPRHCVSWPPTLWFRAQTGLRRDRRLRDFATPAIPCLAILERAGIGTTKRQTSENKSENERSGKGGSTGEMRIIVNRQRTGGEVGRMVSLTSNDSSQADSLNGLAPPFENRLSAV
ncbi:hypothetical protein VTK26DRAFT_3423 [Humicola hyalothermophila]